MILILMIATYHWCQAPLVNNIAVLSDTFHDIMKPTDAGVGHHADAW